MVRKTDIVDQLTEYGTSILDTDNDLITYWFSRRTLKNLRRMRETYQSVLDAFPAAVEL